MHMQRMLVAMSVIMLSFIVSIPSTAYAGQVDLSWTAPTTNADGTPLNDLAGYIVHYGRASRSYASRLDVGNRTSYTLTNLEDGQRYYFSVTAYDTSKNESDYSTEVSIIPSSLASPPPSTPTGLVAAYAFDEGSGSTAADSSGQGQHGTLRAATWTSAGQYGHALHFNGSNAYVELPRLDLAGSELTLMAWVRADGFHASGNRIIDKANGTADGSHWWMLSTIDSGGHKLRFRLKTNGTTHTLIASSGNLSVNTWYHAAAVYNGSHMRLYLNGQLVGSMAKTGTVDTNAAISVNIGRNPSGASFSHWHGRIDEVRLYKRALTASDIQADMRTPLASTVSATNFDASAGRNAQNLKGLAASLVGKDPEAVKPPITAPAATTISPLQPLRANLLEIGEVEVDHNWKRVELQKPFTDPIVVANAFSYRQAQPAVVKINNVDATGFDICIQRWDNIEATLDPEAIGYIVMESGSYTLNGGTMVEAGKFAIDETTPLASVGLSGNFAKTPVVMTATADVSTREAMTGSVANISRRGFKFRIERPEGDPAAVTANTIFYMAWEPSSGAIENHIFEVGKTPKIMRHQFNTILVREPFVDPTVLLADLQMTNSKARANLRWEYKDPYQVNLKIDEEPSHESEVQPIIDLVGYILITPR